MALLRKYLIAGLLVWLPLAITIWVLLWVLGPARRHLRQRGGRCRVAAASRFWRFAAQPA
jgi:uncharacterized membrane protein